MKGSGRRFVVDADVARGALDPAKVERGAPADPRALEASRALIALRKAKHTVVFSPSLSAEWAKHAPDPRFARRWLAQMVEARRVDVLPQEPDDAELSEAVGRELPQGDREVAEKDIHVVILALNHADLRLLSNDGRAREKYARLVVAAPRLAPLHWVGPSEAGVAAWLTGHARDEPRFQLGGAEPAATRQ